MPSNPYDERYQKPGYYWGTKPSVLCDHLLSFISESQRASKLVVDIGCGEGRNAVYMARNGLNVWAMDASEVALRKVVQMAQENGVLVTTSYQNINDCDLPTGFDILFSTGTVQYIRNDLRQAEFERMKRLTKPGGLHAISALLTKPFIPAAPDADATAVLFKSGELLGYYWDWEVLYSIEEIFDCTSGGTPHRHAVSRVIAKKP